MGTTASASHRGPCFASWRSLVIEGEHRDEDRDDLLHGDGDTRGGEREQRQDQIFSDGPRPPGARARRGRPPRALPSRPPRSHAGAPANPSPESGASRTTAAGARQGPSEPASPRAEQRERGAPPATLPDLPSIGAQGMNPIPAASQARRTSSAACSATLKRFWTVATSISSRARSSSASDTSDSPTKRILPSSRSSRTAPSCSSSGTSGSILCSCQRSMLATRSLRRLSSQSSRRRGMAVGR